MEWLLCKPASTGIQPAAAISATGLVVRPAPFLEMAGASNISTQSFEEYMEFDMQSSFGALLKCSLNLFRVVTEKEFALKQN